MMREVKMDKKTSDFIDMMRDIVKYQKELLADKEREQGAAAIRMVEAQTQKEKEQAAMEYGEVKGYMHGSSYVVHRVKLMIDILDGGKDD